MTTKGTSNGQPSAVSADGSISVEQIKEENLANISDGRGGIRTNSIVLANPQNAMGAEQIITTDLSKMVESDNAMGINDETVEFRGNNSHRELTSTLSATRRKQKKFGLFRSKAPKSLKENSRIELLHTSSEEAASPRECLMSSTSPSSLSFGPEVFTPDATSTKAFVCSNGTTPNGMKKLKPY
ncbi:unnamed protein product, partial [Meganyctiphanes norvegica]